MSDQNPTQKGPSIVKPPAEGAAPPAPKCPGCGEPMPGIYLYVFQLAQPAPLPVLLFQAMCCPREDCLTAITILPAGEVPNKIQTPGSPWLG